MDSQNFDYEIRYYEYEVVDSTNRKLLQMAYEGAKEGTVVLANKQTDGRGRRGRTWESPEGDGIYMSLLLQPKIPNDACSMLTLVMALSITESLRELTNLPIQIKWPNDLVIKGKKLAGILTEMHFDEEGQSFLIVGVGINLKSNQMDKKLQEKATGLFEESKDTLDRQHVIDDIMEKFSGYYQKFLIQQNLGYLKETYESYLVNRQEKVCILQEEMKKIGVALGIREDGALIVQYETKEKEYIYAGEVSVRGVYGYV
jgi:BirA family biotin operon repressor/biotin-[acetyl-CoA-carboxylase] ligase